MTSLELADVQHIINDHINNFDNNQSKFIRHCVLFYHTYEQQQNKINNKIYFFQMIVFLSLGIALLSFAISMYFMVFLLIAPVLLFFAGIMVLLFGFVMRKKKIILGGK